MQGSGLEAGLKALVGVFLKASKSNDLRIYNIFNLHANFPFQVFYMQLEFAIKEIITVLSFLFWGGAEDVL